MNHITWLQSQLVAAQTSAAATAEAVQEFRVHLASGKFAGTDTDGSRRDWIATADVTAWLARIAAAGADMQPDLASYDRVLVATSGGKDSLASMLALLEAKVPLGSVSV